MNTHMLTYTLHAMNHMSYHTITCTSVDRLKHASMHLAGDGQATST